MGRKLGLEFHGCQRPFVGRPRGGRVATRWFPNGRRYGGRRKGARMARAGKMTALKVGAAVRTKEPGYYGDGGGLFLQVSRFGTASWVFRYRVAGRLREMGLGSLDTIGLADARERARKAREQRLDGLDPIEVRRASRLAAQLDSDKVITFQGDHLSRNAPGATSRHT